MDLCVQTLLFVLPLLATPIMFHAQGATEEELRRRYGMRPRSMKIKEKKGATDTVTAGIPHGRLHMTEHAADYHVIQSSFPELQNPAVSRQIYFSPGRTPVGSVITKHFHTLVRESASGLIAMMNHHAEEADSCRTGAIIMLSRCGSLTPTLRDQLGGLPYVGRSGRENVPGMTSHGCSVPVHPEFVWNGIPVASQKIPRKAALIANKRIGRLAWECGMLGPRPSAGSEPAPVMGPHLPLIGNEWYKVSLPPKVVDPTELEFDTDRLDGAHPSGDPAVGVAPHTDLGSINDIHLSSRSRLARRAIYHEAAYRLVSSTGATADNSPMFRRELRHVSRRLGYQSIPSYPTGGDDGDDTDDDDDASSTSSSSGTSLDNPSDASRSDRMSISSRSASLLRDPSDSSSSSSSSDSSEDDPWSFLPPREVGRAAPTARDD